MEERALHSSLLDGRRRERAKHRVRKKKKGIKRTVGKGEKVLKRKRGRVNAIIKEGKEG